MIRLGSKLTFFSKALFQTFLGSSPVEHRGTFIRPSVHSFGPNKGLRGLMLGLRKPIQGLERLI